MGCQVIAAISFGDESTEFDILDGHLFATDTAGKNHFQFFQIRIMPQCGDLPYFLFVEIIIQSLQHSVESDFCGVGDERENRMVDVVIDSFQYSRD